MIDWSRFIKPIATVTLLCLSVFALPYSVAQSQKISGTTPTALSSANQPEETPAQRILVLGDSLSAEYGIRRQSGWVELLRQEIKKSIPSLQAEVINASISGDTTSGGVTRLPALLKQHQPTLVIIELGANDALRGLQTSMTHQNLLKMTQMAQAAGAKVVLAGMQIPPNYGPVYTASFREIYPQVAKTTGAALIPFLLAGLESDRSLFIEDGIHPSEKAQATILNNVWTIVQPVLK